MSVSCLRACMNTVYMPEAWGGQKRASVVLDLELQKVWAIMWMLGTEPWSSLKQQVSLITEPTLKTLGSLWRLQYFHWFFENFICPHTVFCLYSSPTTCPWPPTFSSQPHIGLGKSWDARVSEFWGASRGWIYLMLFCWLGWEDHMVWGAILSFKSMDCYINTLPGCWWSWLWSRGSICWVCAQRSDFLCLSILGALKRNL